MVSAKQVGSELRRATTISIMSLTGGALVLAAVAAVVLVFWFAHAERDRALGAWEERLGIVAETRARVVDDWVEDQYRELGALADNAALKLYMTELAQAAASGDRVTEAQAQADYLRNLLTVVADRAGYLSAPRGPDVEANVDRVGVSGIALVDPSGNILAATRGMPPVQGPAFAALLAPPGDGRGFLDIRRAPGGDLVVGFSVPVYAVQADAGAAKPLGRVVGIRTVASGLYPLLDQPGFTWKSAEIYLVRQAGNAVDYLTPRRGNRAPLSGARKIEDPDLVAAIAARGGTAFGIADDYANDRSLFAGRKLSAVPWTVVVKVSRAEALGPSDARRNTLIAVLLTAIALVGVAIVAVWRHGTSLRASEAASRYRDMAHRYEAQSRFLRLVADSQPNPMFIVDAGGRYRFANRAAATGAETSDADMIGKTLSSVLGPAAARRYERSNEHVFETGAMQSEVHRSGANGDLRVVQSEYIPVADGPDFDRGVLVVEQDITAAVAEREHRESALRQLVRTLLKLVDGRDPYAANQSMQVAVVSRAIAEEMGLDELMVETAETAGSLMNVGKLLVPAELLTRPGNLDDDEKRRIRDGIDAAIALLGDVPFPGPVIETLHQMTERWDGSGQPRGIAADDILVTARIVAVANAFVAILNPRAWRPGADFDAAVQMLLDESGKAFDRAVVAALINRLENRGGRAEWADLTAAAPPA